jgi:thiol:disulfide interchange protein DsbA
MEKDSISAPASRVLSIDGKLSRMKVIYRIVLSLLLAGVAGAAIAADPREDREYLLIEPAQPAKAADRIEVIEFFYYGCPVCYETQPHLARWLNAARPDVVLKRVPATGEANESFALTFYALEATGDLARLHWPLYENHHFDDRRLNEEPNLLEWLGRNGVDAERFRAVRNSAENRARVRAAHELFVAYGVRGVPSFAVDGRYLTSARLAGGVKEMMEVVTFLVERARRERSRK